ncbi:hypothetical protein [Flavobacterium sp.]|uniref:hypothetical protein n=1 Tax=Flavobacterium sp. TaxID=239 RepID=UPI0037507470
MTTNTLNNTTFKKVNTKGFLFLVVLFLMSSFSMFAQSTSDVTVKVSNDEVVTVEIKTALVLDDTQLDFMNWFMGSKQSQSANDFSTTNDNSSSSRKKQIISSGITPNRVLYRTLLKKVVSQENAIV